MIKWEGNLVEALADLGTIPISIIIRNCARDFARAGFDATPLAKPIPKPGYLEIWKEKGGWKTRRKVKGKWEKVDKGHFLKWISYRDGLKKDPYVRKHVYGRGWSKASWFRVFDVLGMGNEPKKPKPKSKAARDNSIAQSFGDENVNPGWEMTVGIGFDKRPEATSNIYDRGFANASKNLIKTWEREVKARWK